MHRVWVGVSLTALVVFLLASVQLGRLERGGPPHTSIPLPGGIPATLYVPWQGDERSAFLDPPPRGERPPAVLLVHGFASDRLGMSSLARRLAGSGYAVLSIDLRGHGENRNPFERTRGMQDYFREDLAAAVDFLRATPLVDGSRIAVAGHSMGAAAALDYSTRDSGIDSVVLISGGWAIHGPYQPPNALFLFAAGDPERIVTRVSELAARIAGADSLEPGVTRGDPERGTGVRLVEVPGVDHGTIAWSGLAAAEIVTWLDGVFGIERGAVAMPEDPRFAVVLLIALSLPFVLPGLGQVAGRLVPAGSQLSSEGRGAGLLLLAGGLLATLPLQAVGSPGRIVSMEVGDVLVTWLATAGIVLMVVLALRGNVSVSALLRSAGAALGGAAVATIGIHLLMQPLGVVVHRITLTPERIAVFALAGLALLPFTAAVQLLLRRGPPASATAMAVAGRVLVLLALAVGASTGILGGVVMLMLPALVLIFALFEILAASLYAASRNLAAIALVDAALISMVVATAMPIRI